MPFIVGTVLWSTLGRKLLSSVDLQDLKHSLEYFISPLPARTPGLNLPRRGQAMSEVSGPPASHTPHTGRTPAPRPSGFTCWRANGWRGYPAQSSAPCPGSWRGCGDGRLSAPRCPSPSSPWSEAHVGPAGGGGTGGGEWRSQAPGHGPPGRAPPAVSTALPPAHGRSPVSPAALAYIQKTPPTKQPTGKLLRS